MKMEAYLFAGVAGFFLFAAAGYGWWSDAEPAGTAALTVSFLMSSVICLFFTVHHRRNGDRPEDDKHGRIADRAGRVDFFPARSTYPPVTALGGALSMIGIVYGLWLLLIGFGVLAAGVAGLVFQYVHRGE